MKHNKYKNRVIALALLLGTGSTQTFAQVPKRLSLNEAITLAIQNSGQLKIANAKIDEAIAHYHEAKNNHLPDVKISGSYLRLNTPNVDLKVKTGSGTGGSVKVDQAAYGIVNASLPIFSGLRIRYGIESAKYLEQATRLDAAGEKDEVIQNAILAYSNLYKAKNTVDLVRENLQRENQRVIDFTNLEKNGLMARNDLLKAQLQHSNIELTLMDAESNYRLTCINLDLMLGLPETTQLEPDTTLFQNQGDPGTALWWELAAAQNRKDLNALSYREKASQTAIKATKGEYYPGLALTGGLIAADIPNLLTISNAMNIGIGLQYNLGAIWKTGAKLDGAKARLQQVQVSQSMLSDRIKLEVNKAYEEYLLNSRKIKVYASAIAQANENYRITKNKYDNSLVTTTDLLEADVAQLQSQLNYAFAKVDAAVAYRKLQQTAGLLSK